MDYASNSTHLSLPCLLKLVFDYTLLSDVRYNHEGPALGQIVDVVLKIPLRDSSHKPFPLVSLVVHKDAVHLVW